MFFRQMVMASGVLALVSLTGCAEFLEHEDKVDSNPAVVAKFNGDWNVERQVFMKGKPESTQNGKAVCEMIGNNARLYSADLKLEILFGIRQDGEYALIDVNAVRDNMLVGKDTDDEDKEDENNSELNLKFGKGVYGEIKFLSADTIEITYFKEHDDKKRMLEKILLNRVK